MKRVIERLPDTLAHAFTGFLGTWSALALLCVYTGLSFNILCLMAPLAVAAGIGAGVWSYRLDHPQAPEPQPVSTTLDARWWIPAAAVLVSLLGFYQRWSGWWTWVPCAIAAISLMWQLRGRPLQIDFGVARKRDLVAIAIVAIAGAVAVMGLRRVALDDAYHLSLITGTLDHPGLGALSFDTMHGELDIPLQQPIHRPQTIELLTSLVCRVLGVDIVWVYYFVVPVSFALAMPVLQWVFLRTIDKRTAWLAVLITFVAIMAWGGTSRSIGNYAYTRFYHGKSMFLVGVVPLIAYCGIRFAQRPTRFHWSMLALSQLAAVCLTSSALIVVPPLAGLAVLGATPASKRGLKTLFLGALSCAPVLFILMLVQRDITAAGPLVSDGVMRGMRAVMGTGIQSPIALFAMLSLPALAVLGRRENSGWLARYTALIFVIMLNEPLATWLGQHAAELFSWRWFWGVPTAMLFGASTAMALHVLWQERRTGSVALPTLVLGLVGVFLYVGPWAHDKGSVRWRWLEPKVSMNKRALAQEVVDMGTPNSNILAASTMGWHLGSIHDHPRIIGVRKHYVANLGRFWGHEESAMRWALVGFAEGRVTEDDQVATMLSELDSRCIDIMVTSGRFKTNGLGDLIEPLGFTDQSRQQGFNIWTRDIPPCD
jgi:hypothetical protein